MRHIYLDYNATTPIDPRVLAAMEPYLKTQFGNPSSIYRLGIEARKAVESARKEVASLLNCRSGELVFTSGGSESNNLAIKGVAAARREKGKHIITSCIEHPSVLEVCRYLEKSGCEVSYIPVGRNGIIDLDILKQNIRPDTILISVMHANNETGIIQPVSRIAELAKNRQILFHTDAAQTVGKITTDVQAMGADLLSVAGHKCYGPKGTGALFIREGVQIEKLIHGADHEMNMRAGTENVAQVTGLAMACRIAREEHGQHAARMKQTRDRLYQKIKQDFPEVHLNGDPDHCLPNTLNLSFEGVDAGLIINSLKELSISAGAACHSDTMEVSHVLAAMNIPDTLAMGSFRFSTGRETTPEEIDQAAAILAEKIRETRGETEQTGSHEKRVRLTEFTHGLGCACKLSAKELDKILEGMQPERDARVLCDQTTNDDAAVYQLNEQAALIQTIDFLTPMVDDARDFGGIAAANALSDIYAMGGKPLFALNVAGFPIRKLPGSELKRIMSGAAEVCREAGIGILGGHSIENQEPVFGLVVNGTVHPDRILKNSGAGEGDAIILTKAIGTGLITTAAKRGYAGSGHLAAAIASMKQLNNKAAELAGTQPVTACTDVTGFGLAGHLTEMARATDLTFGIDSRLVPQLPAALEMAEAKMIPGGTMNNLDHYNQWIHYEPGLPWPLKVLMNDAQTSGGLLITLPGDLAVRLVELLRHSGYADSAIIGHVRSKEDHFVCIA